MILLQPTSREYEECLAFATQHGIGFELMDFAFPAVLSNKRAQSKIYARLSGSPVHSLHGVFIDINYSGGDPQIFRVSKKRIEQCAAHAAALGAPRIVLHSCFFPIMPKDDILYTLWSEESASVLCEIAEKYGVEFYIENVLDQTPDIILQMVKKANHPKINVCLDVGHANLTRTTVDEWIEALAPYIKHVHLSDNNGLYDDHIAIGDGNIDWHHVNGLLEKYSVEADYTLEVKPFESVVKSYNYIENGVMPYVR